MFQMLFICPPNPQFAFCPVFSLGNRATGTKSKTFCTSWFWLGSVNGEPRQGLEGGKRWMALSGQVICILQAILKAAFSTGFSVSRFWSLLFLSFPSGPGAVTAPMSHTLSLCFPNTFAPFKNSSWDLPGGPVVKTPSSHVRGPRFNTWSGSWIAHAATKN